MATTPIPEESKVREGEYTPYTDALFLDTDLVEIDENVYSVDINGQLTTAPATDKDVERFVQDAGGIDNLRTSLGDLSQPEISQLCEEVTGMSPEDAMLLLQRRGIIVPEFWTDATLVGSSERSDTPDEPLEIEENWDPNQD